MIDPPVVIASPQQQTAILRLTVPRADMVRVMGPGIRERTATVAAQGIPTTGPWFTPHLRLDPATFDFEIGVPVANAVAPAGRVAPGTRRATRVARTVYHGPYEGLPGAWGELDAWLKAQGHAKAEDLREVDAVGPESGPDPAAWRTELNRPLPG